MKSVKQYNWLQVVEGCSVVSCIVGSIVSVVSQQLMYVSIPLTVALLLNFINRSKFQQQIRQYNKTTVSEMHQAIHSLDQQAQTLPTQSQDLDSVLKSLLKVEQTTQTLAQQFNTRPEMQEIKQLKTEISKLNHLFNTLSLRSDNLPSYTESVDSNELQKFVAGVHERFALLESLNITAIPDELNQLQIDVRSALQQLDDQRNFQSNVVEISSDQVEGLKQEVEQLKFQIVRELTFNIEQLQQEQQILQHQTSARNQHLENLDISVSHLQNENIELRQNLEQHHLQINQSYVLLDNSEQNIIQLKQQLETVQQLVNVPQQGTHSSENIDEIQERLDFLQHLMTEYVKTEYLENVLLDLCEEFSKQIDRVVDLQMAEMNQQLKAIQPSDK